ncbi:VOC family protein [Streptomyces gobiensis]|nr:VOC family protein [Streptomyces gobiensis]UGY95284.1 VOC family protein [Streptomyces gobiensis]
MVRDLEAAQAFYGAVLGWEYEPGDQGRRGDSIALAQGLPVAGLRETAQQMGMPVSWTAYFKVDSADSVVERIRERGATVAVGPLAFSKGRVAWAADPAGAVFAIWEGDVANWQFTRSVGAPTRLELRTRDPFAMALFYGEVFEWDTDQGTHDIRYEHDQVILRIGGHSVAHYSGGAVESAPDPRVRPRWHIYFFVDDVDAAAQRATEAGGSVVAPPSNSPFGRVAGLRDPQGGLFDIASDV